MLNSELNLLPSPVLITNLEGYLVTWNTAFETINVLSEDSENPTHIEAILPLASRVFFQTHVFPMLRKSSQVEELFFYLKNTAGEKIPVMCNAHQVKYKDDEAYCWVLFIARERREFEGELIKAKKDIEQVNTELNESRIELKNANLELEKFVHTVSHDIKAPLVTVEAFSKKLFKDLGKEISEKQAHKFERILLNINHLKRMVEGLLLQSKSESQLTKEKVLISDIMDNLEVLLQSGLEESDAQIIVSPNSEHIYANRLLFTQCLQNLLSNAIRYREHSRQLIIHVTNESREDSDIIHVIDNGIGIRKENLEKIFSLFQGDSLRQGTGVGLSIVKSAMEKHQGRVAVKSKYGEGSCFSLEFPKH